MHNKNITLFYHQKN